MKQLLRSSLFASLFSVISLGHLISAAQCPTHYGFIPYRTIIAFDIDEVLMNGRESTYTAWIQAHPEFAKALDVVKKKYQLHEAMDMISTVANEYPELADQAAIFKDLVISAPKIAGTWQIVKQLAARGYTIIAASNMTSTTYQAMVEKGSLPPEFSMDFYFVQTIAINKKPESGYFKKPEIQYYEHLRQYIQERFGNRFDHFVFIDDKLQNVQAAREVHFDGIQFSTPQQLRKDLRQLGVRLAG